MYQQDPPFRTFIDALKIFGLLAVVRLVMVETGVILMHIPGLDPALARFAAYLKSFLH